ncbi:DUF4825 domain-containing protein [Bacillus sp. SRB3LM]|nr:DUF4825 domain-containing protein [Bacillus sp. SRB3LM]
MKYMHHNMIVMLTIFLFIAACSDGERIKDIYDVSSDDFKKYTGTYVGNNSDVVAIVNHLPGGGTVQSISLGKFGGKIIIMLYENFSSEKFFVFMCKRNNLLKCKLLFNMINIKTSRESGKYKNAYNFTFSKQHVHR